MFISEYSVKHKITVMMMTIAIIIFGVISFTRLGLDMMPEMDFPVISIVTAYQGASPEEIESVVTKNIEMSVSSIKDVKKVTSSSVENFSVVAVEFEWGINLDAAAQDIRDVIEMWSDAMPASVGRPAVMKYSTSSMPILQYGVTGMENSHQVLKVIKDDISNKLKKVDGVAAINVWGGDEVEKQIYVDKHLLERFGVSFDDITRAIAMQNQNASGGRLNFNQVDYYVRTIAEYKTIEEIENTPIKVNPDGSIIRIRDVAEVKDDLKEKRNYIRTNRKPTVAMMVTKESNANTLVVTRAIKKELAALMESGQYDLEFHEIMDFGQMIELSTSNASSNIIFGSILAIVIMYLFIRNWRPTFAISLAIPISVIATFIPLYLMGYSLNLMTLAGLALGVGMLVDNAIVVIENIYRHIENGSDKITAAVEGTKEVALAISASTFTTIAVFLPMVFSTGMASIMVRGLALTVSFSLLVSLGVALTIVPTLSAILFKSGGNIYKALPWFEYLRNQYIKALRWCLHNRGKTVLGVIAMMVISVLLVAISGAEFMPSFDTPFVMLRVKLPKGTVLEETDAYMKQVEEVFATTEGIETFLAMIGPSEDSMAQGDSENPQSQAEAIIFGRLLQKNERDITQEEMIEQMRSRIPNIEGGELVFMTNMMQAQQSSPIELKVYGNDLEQLQTISNHITDIMRADPQLRDVQNTMAENTPEVHYKINRDRASLYGLTASQIGNTIRTAIQGSVIGIFRDKGEEIDIRLQYKPDQRQTLDDFNEIRIGTPLGFSIPLNQVATQDFGEGQARISRERQMRKATITANIHGSDLAGATRNLQKKLAPYIRNMPIGYSIEFGGAYKDMIEGFVTMTLALLLSVTLIYIVMASQFESLKQPFIVMFTLPLCFIGVSLALFLTGQTVSILSFVGMIILCGIIVNNGIVLIDYANQLRAKGVEKHQALIKAGHDRMRPVLITAITTMIGMVPMALSQGQGSEMQNPIAITIIGGLFSATVFTLVVIPVIYSLFDRIKF